LTITIWRDCRDGRQFQQEKHGLTVTRGQECNKAGLYGFHWSGEGFHPAVSPICNRQRVVWSAASNGDTRGRLQACDTANCRSALRAAIEEFVFQRCYCDCTSLSLCGFA